MAFRLASWLGLSIVSSSRNSRLTTYILLEFTQLNNGSACKQGGKLELVEIYKVRVRKMVS